LIIRKAKAEDADVIAEYMMLAMREIIYHFIGEKSNQKGNEFLESLISKKSNQYSYENCWVAESEQGVLAVANVYNGAVLKELRTTVEKQLNLMFNKDLSLEDETEAGEFYIDCIGVNPNEQGKGLGTQMLKFLIDEYVQKQKRTLGLLVDHDNPNARRLYLKLGFEIAGEKTLMGKRMDHLQFKNKSAL